MRSVLALIAATLVAAGCATVPAPGTPSVPWEQQRTWLQSLDGWQVQGRVAVATGDEGWSGNLTWAQTREAVDIRFRGPLGVGGFRIQGDTDTLDLTTSDGQSTRLTDPSTQLRAQLGWHVPLDSLRFWLLGVPDPARPASEVLDTSGRLASLEQHGWRVDFESYRTNGQAWLPRKVTLAGSDVRVRMVLDRWRLSISDKNIVIN